MKFQDGHYLGVSEYLSDKIAGRSTEKAEASICHFGDICHCGAHGHWTNDVIPPCERTIQTSGASAPTTIAPNCSTTPGPIA